MTSAPSLDSQMSLPLLRRHVRYTMARIRTRAWGKTWLTLFEAELKNLDTALLAEAKLSDAVEDLGADVDAADMALDAAARYVGQLVRQVYHGKDRDDMLQALFGPLYPSDFVRPLLGDQLEAMAKWPELLKALPHPAMSNQAPKIDAVVKQADAALGALNKAEAPLLAFRTGVQQPLVKKLDGLRQQLLGEARKQARDSGNPAEAEGLFLRAARRRPVVTTLALARAELAACEQDVAAARQRLTELEEAERAAEQHRQRRRAEEDRLAALLKQKSETEAAIAQARANLQTDRV